MCPICLYRKFTIVLVLRIHLEAIPFSIHSYGQRSKINYLKNDVK